MSLPTISVIVPMFNAERYIDRCLGSLLSQSFSGWEAVVVDDGSTDDGGAVVHGIANNDTRVRLVSQVNRGLSAARNRGVAGSRGRWLLFLDADDWMLPDGLARLLELGEQSAHGLACAAADWYDESGAELGYAFSPGSAVVTHEQLLRANRFQVHSAIVRRDVLGGLRFDESMPALEDWDLWLRLTQGGPQWRASDTAVAAYRLRPSSMSRNPARMLSAAERLFGSYANEPPATSVAASRVRARVALEQLAAWVKIDQQGEARKALLNPSWLPVGNEIQAGLLAEVLWWRVPFLECLPPTAWRSDAYASMLAAGGHRLLGVLRSWGLLPEWRTGDVIQALAERCVDPAAVVSHIEQACGAARVVALHGLGRNAGALLPAIMASGRRVIGNDDAFRPGDRVWVGSGEIEVVGRDAWGEAQAHIVCPFDSGPLVEEVHALVRGRAAVIKWTDATTDISGREHARLLRLWPRTVLGAEAEVAA